VLKRVYFMTATVCFAWDVRVINRRETSFNLTREWSEIVGSYNTEDTVVHSER